MAPPKTFWDEPIRGPKKNCCRVADYFGVECKDCNRPKHHKPAGKNLCNRRREKDNPYEVWHANGWTWSVLRKYQVDNTKPGARWLCFVTSPVCPEGEYGDVYVADITTTATKRGGS